MTVSPLRRARAALAHRRDNDPNPARRLRRLVAEGAVEIGRHSYGTPLVHIWRTSDGRHRYGGTVRIGSFTSIAPGVQILTGGDHRLDWVTTAPVRGLLGLTGPDIPGQVTSRGDVVIGSDVWIGLQAMILSGVTVHHGAVIGARAVVAHDVPPYTVVAGNPAHTLRRRFDDETIDSLLAKAWWDWPDELISARADILCSGDIDRLLALST